MDLMSKLQATKTDQDEEAEKKAAFKAKRAQNYKMDAKALLGKQTWSDEEDSDE